MSHIKHSFPRILVICAMGCMGLPALAGQPLVCLIQPSKIAEVGTSVTGVIETLRIERGDTVKKGQVIAILRNDVERAALNVARSRAQADADVQAAMAGLEFARQSTVRGEDLIKKKFISEQALDKTRTEERVAVQKLAQAREQSRIWDREMSLAKSQLEQRTIVSPISGIVAERYLSSGERVEDRSIARVVSINPLHVEVMVPAANFGKIKTGMVATVMPELPDASPVEATVKLVDKLIDGASNTFRVRLELANPDHAIPAGPRCKVSFDDQVIGTLNSASKLTPQSATVRAPRNVTTPVKVVSPVMSTPQAVEPLSVEKSTLNALENWRRAWESKDIPRYLAAYVANYLGGHTSHEAWINQRESRIQNPGSMKIHLSNVEVRPLAGNQASVRFQQKYQSDGYSDVSTKSMLMTLKEGKWLILEERSQSR